MYTYTWYQWLLFFYFYCFVGWIFESAYVSVKKRKFVNRGFLHAPMLPLYGSGAIVILFVAIPVRSQWYLVFLLGALAATALEYVTGVAMEAMFKVRYWDYSDKKLNFQGQICLSSSLAWGVLSVLLTEVIHRPVERWVTEKIPVMAEMIIAVAISVIFVADTAVSFADAWKLRTILEKMTAIKADIEALQKRFEEVSAAKLEELSAIREESFAWLTGLREESKERRIARKQTVESALSGLNADVRQQLLKHLEHLKKYHHSIKVQPFHLRHSILKRNPSAVSRKFNDAMTEYKKRLDEWKRERM
ncbi:MAG: hypothetical protein KHX56_10230 [Clostridiales bacterium]|nr:hypothetical protein [Clostridiales bacterium]